MNTSRNTDLNELQDINETMHTISAAINKLTDEMSSIKAMHRETTIVDHSQDIAGIQFNSRNQLSLPSNYQIKGMKTLLLWGLWYYGDKSMNVKPYRFIHTDELSDSNSKIQLSRAKKVILRLEDIAVEEGFIASKQRLYAMEQSESFDVFHKSFDVLVNAGAATVNESNLKTTSKKKPLDLLFSTIYDLYTKKSKA